MGPIRERDLAADQEHQSWACAVDLRVEDAQSGFPLWFVLLGAALAMSLGYRGANAILCARDGACGVARPAADQVGFTSIPTTPRQEIVDPSSPPWVKLRALAPAVL